ncbi:type I-F CRISPR-associated endoribonuclease Cas6/Csy4 [Acinetobacter ursingii]|uniref:type I-F CRISPR-associated endoribonuclease Cas6/Csy4 n=1 Tax=Acinetobacter ursingii TaxID=108980 RepID=UPI00148F3561|nr:type I-F CRISPR-associated endoribonuclease Cas6/Csy4 [Acinetobacter ursingii]
MSILNYYQELTIINQHDEPYFKMLSQTFLQLHLAFVEQKNIQNKIPFGISFPEFIDGDNANFGKKIRVFSESIHQLQMLNLDRWLIFLKNGLHWTDIKPVPEHLIKQYLIFKRLHFKTKDERIAHQAKRRGISTEEASTYFSDYKDIPAPYIHMKSLTNNMNFKLFVKRLISGNESFDGFSVYGLSNTSTVPDF